jgi:uncharacterized ion transporter superfamily protein YfcC
MIKKIPDTLVIVFSILVLMVVLTWVIPSGSFDRTRLEGGREIVVAGTYHSVEKKSPRLLATFAGSAEGI